jgi:hypothetical protein
VLLQALELKANESIHVEIEQPAREYTILLPPVEDLNLIHDGLVSARLDPELVIRNLLLHFVHRRHNTSEDKHYTSWNAGCVAPSRCPSLLPASYLPVHGCMVSNVFFCGKKLSTP